MKKYLRCELPAPGEYVWYAASKGAIDALRIGFSKKLAGDGVRANAVSTGLIETEIQHRGRRRRRAPETDDPSGARWPG